MLRNFHTALVPLEFCAAAMGFFFLFALGVSFVWPPQKVLQEETSHSLLIGVGPFSSQVPPLKTVLFFPFRRTLPSNVFVAHGSIKGTPERHPRSEINPFSFYLILSFVFSLGFSFRLYGF